MSYLSRSRLDILHYGFPRISINLGTKKCFVDFKTIQCEFLVPVNLKCGHRGERKCCQNADAIQCREQCAQRRPCGHVCHDHACYEHDTKKCIDCVKIEREKMKKQLEAEEKQRQANKLIVEKQIKNAQDDARLYQGVCFFFVFFCDYN